MVMRFIDIYIGIPLVYIFCFLTSRSRRRIFSASNRHEHKKILIIKFWGIGNVVMLLPAVSALKKKYPQARIDFLTLAGNRSVSDLAKIFDNIYSIENISFLKFGVMVFSNLAKLRKINYDLVIDFEQFARFSALFTFFISRKFTVGFNTKNQHRYFAYTGFVEYDNNIHMSKSFFSLVEYVGVDAQTTIKPLFLNCDESSISEIEVILREHDVSKNDFLIVMHLGTSDNFSERRWPVSNFANLADRLIGEFNTKIVFTGLLNEGPEIKEVWKNIKNSSNAIDLSGKLNFRQYVSLIKISDLVVSADTAAVHLAAATNTPVAGLYGPNTPLLYGPWGNNRSLWFYKNLACSPCITNYNAKTTKCRHFDGRGACMKKITVEEVFDALKNTYFNNKTTK